MDENEIAGTPDTIRLPSAPPSPSTEALTRNVFGIFQPENDLALLEFSKIANKIRLDPTAYEGIRERVVIKSQKNLILHSSSGSESDTHPQSVNVITGYYELIHPSRFPDLGFMIGRGRKQLPQLGIDILITEDKRHGVSGRHARLVHSPGGDSIMLDVDPDKIVYMNKNKVQGERRAISSRQTRLTFGSIMYTFTLTGESTYDEELSQSRTQAGFDPTKSIADATPSEKEYEYDDYSIAPPISNGSYGVVSPCRQLSTGKRFAVKRITRTKSNFERIKMELKAYELTKHHKNVSKLYRALFSHGDANNMGESPTNDLYLVMDFCITDLATFLTHHHSSPVLMTICHHIAQGLGYIHSEGFMHRDIKPSNIMILSYDPFVVKIIDLGQATNVIPSHEITGTPHYRAPEVNRIRHIRKGTYGIEVDLWSLGLVLYQIMLNKGCFWEADITEKSYKQVISDLKDERTRPAEGIMSLLELKPQNRPTVASLLRMSFWPEDIPAVSAPKLV